MSDHADDFYGWEDGEELFDQVATRAVLDQLLADSRLYRQGRDYKDLLEFVVRLRDFAPFNAMLLHVQKPGLSYVASARDWRARFRRYPKESARPLLILVPFGPVGLAYDVMDTEGAPLPEDVASFVAHGQFDPERFDSFKLLLKKKNIDWIKVDEGDNHAGSIREIKRAANGEDLNHYRIHINRNHSPQVQFVTLAHELAHLFLGHLGTDKRRNVMGRRVPDLKDRELEAESVAFIVCERHGVESKSQRYLSSFVDGETTVAEIAVYQVMRAAGQVEALLGLAERPGSILRASPPPRFDRDFRGSLREPRAAGEGL